MSSPYQPATDDSRFLLFDVLAADRQLAGLQAFAESDRGLWEQVLDESAKFVADVVAPLQAAGDDPGCRWQDGEVVTPPGFAAAYRAFWQAGWPGLACAPEDGGQGLPWFLEGVLYESLSAANHGWTMAPGLLHGAYECLKHHGSPALRERYLPRIASGEWLATMCLTEAHAGSDLGLVRTRAVAQADDSFRIAGTKIFISGGQHDLSDNIVHLVLAREQDAPAGPRGLSLFLVPKVLPDGGRNAVHCDGIEHKMGLHGSPTCVMRFDEALGWRVGAPQGGLNAMFVMMNAARLHVALQGVGLLDAAWQKADAYAAGRLQMRAPGKRRGTGAADPIRLHPAVQRILDTERGWVDGGRLLAYQTGIELDLARHHPDAGRRQRAQRWCSLLTPVLKAAWTEQAFHGASNCLQVFGGHGYVRESGIEQIVRDSRVTMIYEGTNEIQAIDLVTRKLLPDGGAALDALLQELADGLDAARPAEAEVARQLAELRRITALLVQAAPSDAEAPFWIAGDYLRAFALALLGWAWTRIEAVAHDARPGPRWGDPALAVRQWVLPEFDMRAAILRARLAPAAGRA